MFNAFFMLCDHRSSKVKFFFFMKTFLPKLNIVKIWLSFMYIKQRINACLIVVLKLIHNLYIIIYNYAIKMLMLSIRINNM